MERLNSTHWANLDEKGKRLAPSIINDQTIIKQRSLTYMKTVTSGTKTSSYVRNDLDWGYLYWAMEKHSNIDDRTGGTWQGTVYSLPSYTSVCYHMWAGIIPSPDKPYRIVVKTPYGKTYTCSTETKIGSAESLSQVNWGKR